MSKRAGCTVIDADGHVLELPTIWAQYLEPAFRERAPRFGLDESGRAGIRVGDVWTGRLGVELTRATHGGIPRAALAGGWDPKQRLADMDAEGIDAAVLFPSMAFFFCETSDRALDAALCRAYNDWLADYCRPAPDRLFGVALLPLRNVEVSVRELERATERHGFRGAFFRPNPYAGRPIHDPAYEPLWACAASLGVPVTVHEGLSDSLPTLGRERFENPLALHALSHPFEQMAALSGLVTTGVLARHPRLRLAFLESGSGWLPYLLDRLDGHFETWRSSFPDLRLRPSEYFARQCFVSCDPDEREAAHVVARFGDDNLVWASDYPHPDACFPGVLDKTLTTLAELPAASRARVLGANAARLFAIEPPGSAAGD
jgi:predicted TIM-barrel fold metal-dependent hydrolase